jgi:hypothetical protein
LRGRDGTGNGDACQSRAIREAPADGSADFVSANFHWTQQRVGGLISATVSDRYSVVVRRFSVGLSRCTSD